MARRYAAPIDVQMRPDGTPAAFTWSGECSRVRVIGRWKLATRWWQPSARVDRAYFRVETRHHQVFELYRDGVSGAWVLDGVLD